MQWMLCYLHCINGETEAQRSKGAHLMSVGWRVAEPGFDSGIGSSSLRETIRS